MLETDCESLPVRPKAAALRNHQRHLMGALEHVQHRPVIVLEKPPRNPDLVIGRNAYQVVIECPMVDRTQQEPVLDRRLTLDLDVRRDVGSVKETQFFQLANRALAPVGDEDAATESTLVETNACLSYCVAPLERIIEHAWLLLVHR